MMNATERALKEDGTPMEFTGAREQPYQFLSALGAIDIGKINNLAVTYGMKPAGVSQQKRRRARAKKKKRKRGRQ